MRLWKTNIIKKPRNLWMPPVPAWSVKKTKERWTIEAFFVNIFLHPLRNPRLCKNKPFIGLQLVVMWFIPLGQRTRGINHVTPRFRPITLTYLLILILLRERLGINLPIKPQKINHASKRVVRIMLRIAFDAHTDLYNLKILNILSIYKFQIGKFMYLAYFLILSIICFWRHTR